MKKNEIEENVEIIDNSKIPLITRKQKKKSVIDENDEEYVFYINSELQDETNHISTSKYTWYNVFPKILIEQFSKMANIYFLIIAIMQSIHEISISGGKPVILLPLAIVVFINSLKDFLEDRKRKKSDDYENNKNCLILNHLTSSFEIRKWKDVKVGQIIKIKCNEGIPADMIILNSSELNGLCYIETKNLDGETNLKYKQSNFKIMSISGNEINMSKLRGFVECKKPDEFIFEFNAKITISNEVIAIDKNSFLLRGCTLKQTDYVYGLVVYVGHNSKIMKNSPNAKHKISKIENIMNFQIIVIFCVQIGLSIIGALMNIIWVNSNYEHLRSYIFIKNNNDFNFLTTLISRVGTWILIFTNLVPISLLVTMEMIKYIQGMFISWDSNLYDSHNGLPTYVQTSTLNEELGQVKYIFSDKTGTLTKNYMEFRKMSIGAHKYGTSGDMKIKSNDKYGDITNVNFDDQLFFDRRKDHLQDNYFNIDLYLQCLALCHTVMIDPKINDKLIYQGSSPDEISLVNAARLFKYIFKGKDVSNQITLEIDGIDLKYECLNVLEYSSERKKMSIIVKCPDGVIRLFTKGADSIIRKNIKLNQQILNVTDDYLHEFANEGLRTLMIAYKEIPQTTYNEWERNYKESINNPLKKDSLLPLIYDQIENDYYLLGSTAIEDKLQDNASETLESLSRAGIKIWMLTGDKMDTARSIAYSCKLVTQEHKIYEIKENSNLDQIKESLTSALECCSSSITRHSLIIGMEELNAIFKTHSLLNTFYELVIKCDTVICCRTSPKQKAQMVNLIKQRQPNSTTLAIGDGANDVNMITSAHIGIGIIGVEGMQAARASDYAIGKFSCLRRLLLVHGRESYRKNSFVVCYNFYKNMLFVIPQFWFGYTSYYSGQTLYDPWIYQLFNIIFTSIPIIWFGIYDKETNFSILYHDPRYYIQGLVNKLFHSIRFWKWIIYGMIQGFIIFVFSFYCNQTFNSDGNTHDLFSIGSIVYSEIVLIVNFRILFTTNTHSIISLTLFILSILSYYIVLIIMSQYYKFDNFNNTRILFKSPSFYLSTVLILVLTLLIDVGIIRALNLFNIIKNPLHIDRDTIHMSLNSIDISKKDKQISSN